LNKLEIKEKVFGITSNGTAASPLSEFKLLLLRPNGCL